MKIIGLSAAIVMLLAINAAAANPFDNAYGNTVRQTWPDGSKYDIYVNPDMTWAQRGPDGQMTSGTYKWKDATHVCFKQISPNSNDKPDDPGACVEMKGDHKVGETWTDPLPGGKLLTTTIVGGRT